MCEHRRKAMDRFLISIQTKISGRMRKILLVSIQRIQLEYFTQLK